MNTLYQDAPTLTAVFELPPEGGFTCTFEELPEVFSEGERWTRPAPTSSMAWNWF